MQLHHANTLEIIEAVPWPVTLDRSDFSPSNRDEVLALLAPSGHSKPTIWLVAVALAAGFGLGWAGAWYAPATISALNPNARIEPASRRMPDTKSGGKAESGRKIASSQAPPGLGQPSTVSASLAPKPLAKASSGGQSPEALNPTSSVFEADTSVTGSLGPAGPLLSVPETRPTTIGGGQSLRFAAERRCSKDPMGFEWQHGGTWSPASAESILSYVGATAG